MNSPNKDYAGRPKELQAARRKADGPIAEFQRTTHPDAQWFPQASFGLFIHWGIHSVAGIEPSWAMIKDYRSGYSPAHHPPENYYKLAAQFDPQDYDPEKWIVAAKSAGMTYVVLTTKHHDGYCLWPTAYGKYNTRTFLGGRDLLQPYVNACRKHGLRVGFYFSPRDWSFPGYPLIDVDFDYKKRGEFPPVDPIENRERFEAFYVYIRGQMEELLTRYGKIDLLWFDGVDWHGIHDPHTLETIARIRSLQPHIVCNDRWQNTGDFKTPECRLPEGRPAGWWEACAIWNGHWGYNADQPFKSNAWVLENLVTCRKWGGNFLLNCGPDPHGRMPAGFYERCLELSRWITHSGESVIGADPSPGDEKADVPITARDGKWFLHMLAGRGGRIHFDVGSKPVRAIHLASGKEIQIRNEGHRQFVELDNLERNGLDDVIMLTEK